jgi:hypothetical protein
MKQKKTKADVIRAALAKNPETKISDIAKMLGCKPQEIYMVRYHDKKRANKKPRVANKSPKRVAENKETWSPSTPAPEWTKRNLSNEMDAVKQTIAEIKARNPDSGKPMAMWEIVVICLAAAFLVNLGMRLAGIN